MESVTTPSRRPFMDCFYALADIDDTVRHDAVVDLLYYLASSKKHGKGLPGLQKDYQANVAYTIKRLVRGLGSSRGCARQGFSLGLTELLRLTMKKSPEKFVVQDVQSVVDMIASENAVNGSQKRTGRTRSFTSTSNRSFMCRAIWKSSRRRQCHA